MLRLNSQTPGPIRLLLLATLIGAGLLVACASEEMRTESTEPGGLDPIGTAAVQKAQAQAAEKNMQRIAQVTANAQAAIARATDEARQNEARATQEAQAIQATRLAGEVRATDQAIASEATSQAQQATRIAQEVQATQTSVAMEVRRTQMELDAHATATAAVYQQQLEQARLDAEQARQRNESIWQVLLTGVGVLFAAVVLVFVILSVRPAVVKMWDSLMRSRENLARIEAASRNPIQIVEEPRDQLPVQTVSTLSSLPSGKYGSEDIVSTWDGISVLTQQNQLELTKSIVLDQSG
jgi:hypothetical protein